MDPDPDPAFFVIDLQDANKKKFSRFFCYYFLKVHLFHFSEIKSHKEVITKQLESRLLFLLDDRRIRSQSRIHTSDSRRLKNTQIRIRNTVSKYDVSPRCIIFSASLLLMLGPLFPLTWSLRACCCFSRIFLTSFLLMLFPALLSLLPSVKVGCLC
jgi:hypothetical protein